jgi:Rrf2 family protein
MWISGTSQYAIRAVVYVATRGAEEPVRVGPIATALDVPQNYLSKTLYALARAGVLRSVRGPRGGFQLAVPPDRLTLARVAAPFDDVGERHCLLGRSQCGDRSPCAAHARWGSVSDSLQDFFRNTTVADLMDDVSARASRARL